MNQAVHIFRKDVRHLLPELGVYAAVLIAYSWAEPFTWRTGADLHSPTTGLAGLLLLVLRPLIPLLWFAMISRLVHDESLVGDRQFWLTRPYNRASLAAAKILFVLVCIVLPFALMQTYLIAHAGLGVRQAVPDMFRNLCTFGLTCWLPFIALAAITSSLVRMLLAAVSVFLAFFLFTLFVTLNLVITHATPPLLDNILATLFALMVLGTILFQYMTRYTTASRLLLGAAFVVIGILRIVAPADLLFKVRYPSAPRLISYDATRKPGTAEAHLSPLYGRYVLTLPIGGGNEGGAIYNEVASSYTIDTRYAHYTSGWQRAGLGSDSVSIYIAPDVLARFGGSPAILHINIVGRRLLPVASSSFDGSVPFDIPDNGRCLIDRSGSHPTLICRYAFASPPDAVLSEEPRSAGPGKMHALQAKVASPSFDPIAQAEVALNAPPQLPARFSVTTYQSAERVHTTLDASIVSIAQHLSSSVQ